MAVKDDPKPVELDPVTHVFDEHELPARRMETEVRDWNYKTHRLPPSARAFFIGNDAGGSGKTTLAHLIAIWMERNYPGSKLIEAEITARISGWFPEMGLYHEANKDQLEHGTDADAIGKYWDALARQITRTPTCVIDLSANAVKSIDQWARSGSGRLYLGEGEGINLICPITAESKAINAGLLNIQQFARAFPKSRRILVVNPVHGKIPMDGPQIETFRRVGGEALEIRTMPLMMGPAWQAIQRIDRFDRLHGRSIEELIEEAKIEPGEAARTHAAFVRWASATFDWLEDLMNPPAPAKAAE